MLLGLGQVLAEEDRGGRSIGFVLVAGGAFAILHSAVRMLFGTGF